MFDGKVIGEKGQMQNIEGKDFLLENINETPIKYEHRQYTFFALHIQFTILYRIKYRGFVDISGQLKPFLH